MAGIPTAASIYAAAGAAARRSPTSTVDLPSTSRATPGPARKGSHTAEFSSISSRSGPATPNLGACSVGGVGASLTSAHASVGSLAAAFHSARSTPTGTAAGEAGTYRDECRSQSSSQSSSSSSSSSSEASRKGGAAPAARRTVEFVAGMGSGSAACSASTPCAQPVLGEKRRQRSEASASGVTSEMPCSGAGVREDSAGGGAWPEPAVQCDAPSPQRPPILELRQEQLPTGSFIAPEVQLLRVRRGKDVLRRDPAAARAAGVLSSRGDAWGMGVCLTALTTLRCPAGCARRKTVVFPAPFAPGSESSEAARGPLSIALGRLVRRLCDPDPDRRMRLHEAWVCDEWVLWARKLEMAASGRLWEGYTGVTSEDAPMDGSGFEVTRVCSAPGGTGGGGVTIELGGWSMQRSLSSFRSVPPSAGGALRQRASTVAGASARAAVGRCSSSQSSLEAR